MNDEVLRDIPDRKKEDSIIRKVAFYSLLVNIFLVVVKLYITYLSGSLSVKADAINSFIDVFVSLLLLAGIWLSSLKSSKFPYGLYKVENLISIVISLLVFLTAWEVFTSALFGEKTELVLSGWFLFAVFALAFVPYLLGRYEIIIGTRYSSPGLIADGKQHNMDVFSTMVVFLALLGQYFGIAVDNLGAIIVAGFIAYAGWEILKESMKTLLDASVDYKTRDLIKSAILSDPLVVCVKELNARNSGRYIFVEATVNMKKTDLSKAHLASERIESGICSIVPSVERVTIHYEPQEKLNIRYIVPLENKDGKISSHFGESLFFAILDIRISDLEIFGKDIILNPCSGQEKQKGICFAKYILRYRPDVVISKKDISGKSMDYVFESSGIDVKLMDFDYLPDLISNIQSGLKTTQESYVEE
ncbi:MAG: cation diffusion facilitator family transporter [Methanomicrobium sp.]|nr:cation diffusion facilitator family transporter [Methanomicrobium sp.]